MPRARSTKRKKASSVYPTAWSDSQINTLPKSMERVGISISGSRITTSDSPTWTGVQPCSNPLLNDLVQKLLRLHDQKNHDYAAEGDPFSNFTYAAQFAGVPVDTVFKVLMGVKWARLHELTRKDAPRNEPEQDTRQDLALYTLLWAAYHNLPPF